MQRDDPGIPGPRSVGPGCVLGAVMALLAVGLGVFVFVFLDSGADRGRVTLLDARAYGPGTVTHVPERGFFLVKLDVSFVALSDLDAANRAQGGRRCRVHTVTGGVAAADDLIDRYRARAHPAAQGARVVLAEDCNGAVYDITGTRLDTDGPNLDRLGVEIDQSGRVVVDTQARSCSVREGGVLAAAVDC